MKLPGTKWIGRLKLSLGILVFLIGLPLILAFNAVVALSILLRKGLRGINRDEALALRSKQVSRFKSMTYEQVEGLLRNGHFHEDIEEVGASGVEYNICIHAGFLMPPGKLITVEINVNDDGWSQYFPVATMIGVAPEEGWVLDDRGEITNKSSREPGRERFRRYD